MTPDYGPDGVRDYDEWRRSLRNFTWLNRVVPGATDLDQLFERHGNFLVLESKRWALGIRVPLGQHLALSRLAQLDVFTVYLIGQSPEGVDPEFHVVPYNRFHPVTGRGSFVTFPASCFEPMARVELRALVRSWWDAQ